MDSSVNVTPALKNKTFLVVSILIVRYYTWIFPFFVCKNAVPLEHPPQKKKTKLTNQPKQRRAYTCKVGCFYDRYKWSYGAPISMAEKSMGNWGYFSPKSVDSFHHIHNDPFLAHLVEERGIVWVVPPPSNCGK